MSASVSSASASVSQVSASASLSLSNSQHSPSKFRLGVQPVSAQHQPGSSSAPASVSRASVRQCQSRVSLLRLSLQRVSVVVVQFHEGSVQLPLDDSVGSVSCLAPGLHSCATSTSFGRCCHSACMCQACPRRWARGVAVHHTHMDSQPTTPMWTPLHMSNQRLRPPEHIAHRH